MNFINSHCGSFCLDRRGLESAPVVSAAVCLPEASPGNPYKQVVSSPDLVLIESKGPPGPGGEIPLPAAGSLE